MTRNPYQAYLEEANPYARYARHDDRMNGLQAFGSGAADSFSLGLGDELLGWGAGALGALGGQDFGETANRVTAESRRRRALAESQHGGAFLAGQVGGAVVGGGGLGLVGRGAMRAIPAAARIASNVNWAGRAGAAALSGGAGGLAYGAFSGDAGNRAESALQYGVPGAIFGGGLSALGSAVGPHISNFFRATRPNEAAADIIGQAMVREVPTDSQFAQRLAEHATEDRGGMVLDALGESGSHVAMGSAVRPSAGRRVLKEAMDARQMSAGPRAQREVWEELVGGAPEDVAEFTLRMDRVKRADAAPLYAQAWREAGRIGPDEMAAARETVRRHPAIFGPATERARLMALAETGEEVADPADPRYWHYMLQGAERELGARLRAASMGDLRGFAGSEAAIYSQAVRQFNNQVRTRLGATFRQAQDTYAGASAAQDAAELGYSAIGGNLNTFHLGVLRQRLTRMSQAERDSFRAAAANKVQDMIANATRSGENRSDALRGVIGTEGRRRVLTAIFGERGLETLLRRFDYDRQLLQNSINTGIRVNSITAPAQAAAASIANMSSLPSSASGVIDRVLGPQLRRRAEQQSEEVADLVLSILAMPADEAAARLARPVRRRGLLSRARAESASDRLFDDSRARRDELLNFRSNALANNLFAGVYSGVGGSGGLSMFGVGGY